MSLPNPDMEFFPFDPLAASELNDLVENIKSLADGSGFDAGAIGVDQRSGGFKVGAFTLSGTGAFPVTGVGFEPKAILFFFAPTSATGAGVSGVGLVDGTTSRATALSAAASAGTSASTSVSGAIRVITSTGTLSIAAALTSLDSDGFTLNVTSYGSTYGSTFYYLALG